MLRRLVALVILFATASNAFAQQSITLNPRAVKAGTSVNIYVTPSTGLDLSGIYDNQVVVHPHADITHLQARPQTDGTLSVMFSVERDAALGERTLILLLPGNRVLSTVFSVVRADAMSPPSSPSGPSEPPIK